MLTPGKGSARWLRGGLLALLTVLIPLGAHVLAGGVLHLSTPLLLGAAALAALSVAAADVRRSFGEIFVVVMLAQPVLHLLASMGGHGASDPTEAALQMLSPMMALAHVGAAVLVSTLLAGAERSVWALASLFRPIWVPQPTQLPHPMTVTGCHRDEQPGPIRWVDRCSGVTRRGPPPVVTGSR